MLKSHVKRTIIFAILGTVISIIAAKLSKPVYEGVLEMLIGDQTRSGMSSNSVYDQEVMNILNKNNTTTATTERQVLSSLSVFYQSLNNVAQRNNDPKLVEQFGELYRMYDIETARTTNQMVDAGVALVRVRAYSPEVAAAVANEISVVYNEVRLRNSRESVQEAINYLTTTLTSTEKELKSAEQKLKDYKTSQNIADLTKLMTDETTTLTSLENKKQSIEAELKGSQAELERAQSSLRATPKYEQGSETSGKSSQLQQLESDMIRLKGERDVILTRYLEDSDEARQISEAIAAKQKQIDQAKKNSKEVGAESKVIKPLYQQLEAAVVAVNQRMDNLRAQQAEVANQITEQQAKINNMPAKEQALLQLTRELRIADDRYNRIKAQLEQLQTRGEASARAALVLNRAEPDPNPIAPDVKKWIIVGTTAGVCLGLLYSFVLESLRLRIQSSTQLTALTGLPVVAAIPSSVKTGAKALRAMSRPEASPPEAFRYMAFSMVTNSSKTMRSFMFTGIKTSLTTYSSALQFAVAVARSGTRVLLVDVDMLKSPVSQVLDAGGKPGLSNLLSADTATNVEEYIVPTVHPNLVLMPGGTESTMKFVTNAPQAKLEAVLQALRLHSEVIIFAVPPCDVLADAACMAKYMDDVCMVVSAAQTNYRSVPLAQDLLSKAGAKNISIVMADASADEEPFAKRNAYITRA